MRFTSSTGRFFSAERLLPLKKSLPFTLNSDIGLPLYVMVFPSISTPGRSFTSSSRASPSGTLYSSALKLVVSSFVSISARVPTTVATFSATSLSGSSRVSLGKVRLPRFVLGMLKNKLLYPIMDMRSM